MSGRAHVVHRDGAELDIEPNAFYEIPPGHDAWVVGDEEWISIDWGANSGYARGVWLDGPGGGRHPVVHRHRRVDPDRPPHRRHGLAPPVAGARCRHSPRPRPIRRREVGTTGDGFLAMFDGAERAVQAGGELAHIVARDAMLVRVGIHTGEVETESGNVRGLAVHVAARVMALAGPGEVLVSWTTRDLLMGCRSPSPIAARTRSRASRIPCPVYALVPGSTGERGRAPWTAGTLPRRPAGSRRTPASPRRASSSRTGRPTPPARGWVGRRGSGRRGSGSGSPGAARRRFGSRCRDQAASG